MAKKQTKAAVAKKPVVKKVPAKKVVAKKTIPPPMVDSLDEDYPEPVVAPEPVVEVPAAEPFDTVIVEQVPVCEEKTGQVIKMNYFNAAGQLVR